jgi:hypothetical protein
MANRPKVTQPVTDNKERALEENRHTGSRSASPSRAAEQKTGGGHEKKPTKAPK